MRVKISKTISMDDLPGEARRILDIIKNRVVYNFADSMSGIIRSSLSTDAAEYFQTIELIETFRSELASLDENLQEVLNMLQGHKNTLYPPEKPEPKVDHDAEWLAKEEAEYEKFMSQVEGAEEGFNEEG